MPSRVVCFVCGSLGGEYQLRSRPCEGFAYFPFLEHHDPPKGSRIPGPDGLVDSCRVCYAFLTQQWETYERSNTPAIKRLYWLKRLDDGQFTGAEMKLQGEYMAQVMGLQYQPCSEGCAPLSPDSRDGSAAGTDFDFRSVRKSQHQDDGDRVLDLSVSVKSDTSAKSSNRVNAVEEKYVRDASNPRPGFDEFSFVCYTCGTESEGVAAKFISSMPHVSNEPFFPFLAKLSPPKGTTPITSQGVCQVCDRCFSSLCHQWLSYEHHGTPNSARIFKVNSAFFSNDSNITVGSTSDAMSGSGEVCYLCGKTWSSTKICSLYTAPVSGKGDQMYFPFIRELRRPHGARPLNPDGTVLVCISCLGNLQGQWQRYEAEKVPFLHRRYSLLPPSTSSLSGAAPAQASVSDADIKSDVIKTEGSSKLLSQASTSEIRKSPKTAAQSVTVPHSHLTLGAAGSSSSATLHEVARHSSTDSKSHSSGTLLSIPHPLQQAGERPKKVCFLCGEKCLVSKAQILYSYPARHETKNIGGQSQTVPFFPFLANHTPAPGSESLTEEGTVIACAYCYYSLLNQWRDFEESKGVTDRNRWLRKYTLNEFVCFVCGMMVPRKKMRTLEVQKFAFLREHKAPPNALVMWGGECVGACGSCHFSLTHQFAEFERLGLPVELRKYNWTVQHHIEDNSCDANDSSSQDLPLAACNEDSNLSVGDEAEDSSHGTRAHFSMLSSGAGKFPPKAATASPHNLLSPSNGLTSLGNPSSLHSPRTSSFAAALRNLAHHAKDPAEDHIKHSSSPPSAHQSSHPSSPNKSVANLVLSSHHLSAPFSTPLMVSISGHSSTDRVTPYHESHGRASSSRPSSTFEPWSKSEADQRPQSSDSRNDSRSVDRESRGLTRITPQRPLTSSSLPLSSQAMSMYARGFHTFRPEEDENAHHALSVPYGIDPAAYAAAAGYHPALLQQQAAFSQGSMGRLNDSLLLEQYHRMLQSSYLPFSTAGLMSPHAVGLGVHSMLAAAASSPHYPPGLLPQHYPFFSPTQHLLDPQVMASSAMVDRSHIEAEKAREKRLKDKEAERRSSTDREMTHKYESGQKERHSTETAGSGERRDILSVPRGLPMHLSKEFTRHRGDDESTHVKSISASSSHGHGSKLSASSHSYLKTATSPAAATSPATATSSSFSHSLSNHHSPLRLHQTLSSAKDQAGKSSDVGMTYPSFSFHAQVDKESSSGLHHSAHHYSKYSEHSVLSLSSASRDHSSTTAPHLLKFPSVSNHSVGKGKVSETPSLFRPFDDPKQTVSVSSDSNKSSTHHSHRHHDKDWYQHGSGSLHAFHPKSHHIKSDETTNRSTSDFDRGDGLHSSISSHHRPQPTSSLHHSHKHSSHNLNERIERFDFKSLALECSSSSVRSEANIPEMSTKKHAVSQCVSKLDYAALRAKERKRKGGEADSDSENMEEERMRARLTMIGRTTPIPLETPPAKMELFEALGLTVWSRKRELNRQKEIRRRRQLRLASLSPVQHDVECLEDLGDHVQSVLNRPSTSADHHKHSVATLDSDTDVEDKSEFLTSLGLAPLSDTQKADMERKRRHLQDVSWKRNSWVTADQSENGLRAKDGSSRKRKHEGVDKNYHSPSKEPNIGLHRLGRTQQHPYKQHQYQFGNTHADIESPSASSSLKSSSQHTIPPWPGVEAVMESYHQYRAEQLTETKTLQEHRQQLETDRRQLQQLNHTMGRQMAVSYLLEENQRMEEERKHYQDAISSLKESVYSLR